MRILYHHRTRSRDGQRVHIDGLIDALRAGGHEVREVGPAPPDEDDPQRAGGRARAWLRPGRELAEWGYNWWELRQLEQAAKHFQPDVLYSRHALFTCSPRWVSKRLGVPWIVEVNAPLAHERERHGGLFWSRWARGLETRTLNAADAVVVVTAVMRDMLVEQGVRPDLVEVHPNGVRLGATPQPEEPLHQDGEVVLGFVGFVRDWNRLERTFEVLRARPELVFVVVGDGPDRPRLEALAREREIADRLRFTGAVAADRVRGHVAHFDVALITETPIYASPLKLLDYLAEGRAVLAPNRPNLREVLEHEQNALLFDPDDESDFRAQLERLLDEPALRERLGAAARATIDERGLTWAANAERVVRRFQSLSAGDSE